MEGTLMSATAKNRPMRNRTFFWTLGGLLLVGGIASLAILVTRLFPGEDCNPPTLTLGTKQFVIKTIRPKSDGSLKVSASREDTAFWVDGTDTNQAFALSPTANNLALETTLKAGDQAVVTWANCNSTTYILSAPRKGVSDLSALLDQSVSEITIFIQADSDTTGFVVKGELAAETISAFNTPDPSEIQAEISLLETTASADGKTIRVGVSILNTGQSPITLTVNDVSLAYENNAPIVPDSAEPALPLEINPGASETIYFVFPQPSSEAATFKVLSVEYELEGY
jgi:hypothetical protein